MAKRGTKTTKAAARSPVQIETVGDADRAVMVLGQAERLAAALRAALEEKVTRLREEYAARIGQHEGLAAALRADLETWAEHHPEAFPPNRRSLDLAHGRIGWREVVSVRLLRSADFVIAALEAADLDAVTVVKRDNKDVLAAYDDETLGELGARRKRVDRFYADPADEAAVGAAH